MRKRKLVETDIAHDFYAPGRWWMFPVVFIDLGLSHADALMMSYLDNHRRKVGVPPEEWFYCKMEQLCRDLRLKHNAQSRSIRRLKDIGFLQTRIEKRLPARRLIRIKWKKIYRRILDEGLPYYDSSEGE